MAIDGSPIICAAKESRGAALIIRTIGTAPKIGGLFSFSMYDSIGYWPRYATRKSVFVTTCMPIRTTSIKRPLGEGPRVT